MNSNQEKISSLSIGTVELNVNNIELMKQFYSEILTLDIITDQKSKVVVGKNNKPLIVLHHEDKLPQSAPSEAGLYHFAILYASRSDLGRTIEHILKHAPGHFSGSGDHLVSEAFYFYDPEGNGIELYFDRDRTEWQWENGQIKMATGYIDPKKYIQSNLALEDIQTDVGMGHIHLKVGDLKKAKDFYTTILGFNITAELPGALFISIGGYHHHIGINVWESFAAVERDPSLGLRSFELIIPEFAEVKNLAARLKEHHIQFTEVNGYIAFFDPWKNQIRIKYENKYN
jgi:catechol 2,3-dioxygenase